MKLDKEIYKKLLHIPSGKITSYGELAHSVGLKNGQRAIGQILKKNPFPVIIPCHRVVKSNRMIGGYAFGVDIKRNMLTKEGICIKNDKIENFEKSFFRF